MKRSFFLLACMVLSISAAAQSKNVGTQVWMVPPPAGDLITAVQHPDQWQHARGRVDVFAFYQLHAYDHPGFECGPPCGPNTYRALLDAVPGGAFRWVHDHGMAIALESPSVKEYACTKEAVVSASALPTVRAINNIIASGAEVDYVSQDEPFTGGRRCERTAQETAQLVKLYVDTVHHSHPGVQIGLIEPYPFFSVDEIMSYVLELEHAGVDVPYFHLDLDLQRSVREHQPIMSDLRRLREFFRAKGIPFGVIIWGQSGVSNAEFSEDAWGMLQTVAPAVGITEHTIVESWAENPIDSDRGPKTVPDVVPESDPLTLSGLLLHTLAYLGVQPVS